MLIQELDNRLHDGVAISDIARCSEPLFEMHDIAAAVDTGNHLCREAVVRAIERDRADGFTAIAAAGLLLEALE